MIIEEMLNQRILGVKNEKGVYITPAFPKLIYVLEEDNIHENSKYWYLTKLAAQCTAKRMVPDYISEKIMKKLKDGNCYPCMGCLLYTSTFFRHQLLQLIKEIFQEKSKLILNLKFPDRDQLPDQHDKGAVSYTHLDVYKRQGARQQRNLKTGYKIF